MTKTPNLHLIRISKIISNFFNPLISLSIYFFFRNLQIHSFSKTILLLLPLFLIIVLPILLWIYWNIKKGNYADVDVSDRHQRKNFYFFIAVILVTYHLYEYLTTGTIDFTIIFILALLFVLQISNYFIKSSMHTAFNIFVAALFFAVNQKLGIIWLGISLLVGLTRIILKRHTPKEVFFGAVIALLISFIYLYAHIQIQN